ncbi:MAG: amidohydrolase family protein, partial [Planctomycetaceae bacterium]|nr:amidohydrolase family protein [Planctomycetaceae bacterium]
LSEDAALAALTTYPALVLGIDKQAGTVEKGKMANLILTDRPFFTEKSNIVAVFVEGKMYRQEIKSQKKSSGKHGGQQKFDGTWSYTVSFPEEPQKGNIFISTSGPNFTIQIEDNASDGKRDDAKDITADGNKLTFSVIAQLGKPTNVDFDLTFDGDSYDGTILVEGFGVFPIEGTRISSPETKSMFK